MFEVSPPGRDATQFNDTNVILGVLAFIWMNYIWELFLKIRQHLVLYRETKVPPGLQESMQQDVFSRSRSYNLEKSAYTIAKDFIVVLLRTSVVISKSHAKMWGISSDITRPFGFKSVNREIVCSCVAVGITNVINSITLIPFKMFETFFLDRRYGLSRQTIVHFFHEQTKLAILSVFLIEPMVAGIVYIVRTSGDQFFIHLWLYVVLMVFIYVSVYSELIGPIFETYVPVLDGELPSRIRNMSEELKVKPPKIYIVEGGRRTYNNQVSLTGSIHPRVDIDCNLVKGYKSTDGSIDVGDKGLNNDMLIAMVAHEFSHRQLNHLVKKSTIIQGSLLLEFFIFSRLHDYPVIYTAFGFSSDQPVIMGFVITMEILLAPYHVAGAVIMGALSRKFEEEADQFTKSIGLGAFLRRAVATLAKDNLIFPIVDPLYYKWFDKFRPWPDRLETLQ